MEITLTSVVGQRREKIQMIKNEVRHDLTAADKKLQNILWESGIDVAHEVMQVRAAIGRVRERVGEIP